MGHVDCGFSGGSRITCCFVYFTNYCRAKLASANMNNND